MVAERVFIFGAGASKQGGAPVMSNFIQEAERVLNDTTDQSYLGIVLRFSDACKSLHAYSNVDLDNLETLYGLAEMAEMTKRFPNYSSEDITEVVRALRRVIVKTIEKTLTFPYYERMVAPPEGYRELVESLREIEADSRKVAFITFNYDLGLDYALRYHSIPHDYCIDGLRPGTVPLLKLHGSLNWFLCESCNRVVTWNLNDFFQTGRWQHLSKNGQRHLDFSDHLDEMPHDCSPSHREPLIVPPTWNKPTYRSALKSVWATAADVLSDVRDLIVIGFSLPETDLFFKYLYSIGTASARLRQIRVFDPDERVRERFEGLLGQGAKAKFTFEAITFSEAISKLWGSSPRVLAI